MMVSAAAAGSDGSSRVVGEASRVGRGTDAGPSISVVMPVHNALPHLDEAIESILGQTRSDFEFVIYDDASNDGSTERLQEWAARDKRIRLFRGERNLGPAGSSNAAVKHSTGALIARMDADDISRPERIERQSEILLHRPDVGMIGSLCVVIDSHGERVRGPEHWRISRKSWAAPFPHGSIMMRRELFDSIGGYREQCEFWEDLDLVLRSAQRSKILVVPQPLYWYRQSETSTRLMSDQSRVERALDLRYRSIARILRNRDYDDVLADARKQEDERLDPRVFVSLGSLALWSNQRPKIMRRLLSRANLGFDFTTSAALVWAAWASLSPGTLRALMNLVSRMRNLTSAQVPSGDEPVEWRTPKRAESIAEVFEPQ